MFSFFHKNTIPNAAGGKAQEKQKITLTQKIKIVAFSILVAIGLSLILVYLAHAKFVVNEKNKQLSNLTQHRADLTADNIRSWINGKQTELTHIAGRPMLKDLIVTDDTERLTAMLNQLKKSMDGILALRVFKAGSADLDANSLPPIRYSELAMIRSAEKGEIVPPELARIENKWLLNFSIGIHAEGGEKVAGVVFATFDTRDLRQSMARVNQGRAKYVLQQKVAEAGSINTLSIGEGGTLFQATADVPASWWAVAVEAAPNLEEETLVQSSFIYAMVLALSCTLILIAYLVGRFIGGRLDEAGLTVTKGIGELVTSKKPDAVDTLYKQNDILDIAISDTDEALLGLEENAKSGARKVAPAANEVNEQDQASIPEAIFRAYDIRGLARKEITKEIACKIGHAVGSEALDNNESTLIVARDARIHSPELTEYLIRGILQSGCNVLNIGTVPTPLMYFATETLSESRSGVMVTASHNPAEYNGFKIVINGVCRAEEDIKAIRSRILSKNLHDGKGSEERRDIVPNYIDTIFSDVALAGDVNIVIDAGNGVTGLIAPRLFEELGCQVTPLFCDIDGNFPNHNPDPSVPQNLRPLIEKVKEEKADLGVAFDGDGDRLVVVTASGKVIWPDKLLMLFAKDIISRSPGSDVIFDVKSTRHLASSITEFGGRPIMWKTGHSPMKSKMTETGALLGGEYSGHVFIKDRWYGFDDGMYAAARLLEIMTLQGESLDEMMDEYPSSPDTPEIRIKVDEQSKFTIMEKLIQSGDFGEAKISHIDGVRAEYNYGWGLVRASNTSPCLTMRFEADDDDAMLKLKSTFVQELRKIDPSISVDWE